MRFCYPNPEDFDTDEEYQYAVDAYDDAVDFYVEEYLERHNS